MWSCAWQSQIFRENSFCPPNWENGPKIGQKQGFLNLLENLVINFYWIWSVMKIYIICFVPAQIPYLGKIFVPEIWAKIFSANQDGLQDFLINHISRTNQWNSHIFLHFDANSLKLKVDQKFFWVGMVENGYGLFRPWNSSEMRWADKVTLIIIC